MAIKTCHHDDSDSPLTPDLEALLVLSYLVSFNSQSEEGKYKHTSWQSSNEILHKCESLTMETAGDWVEG